MLILKRKKEGKWESMKKILALILSVCMIFTCLASAITVSAVETEVTQQTEQKTTGDTEKISAENSYFYYLQSHDKAELIKDTTVEFDLSKAKLTDAKYEEYEGEKAVVIDQLGKMTLTFNVAKEGYYMINSRYAAVPGKPINMELCVYIDGKIPYTEATTVTVPRTWEDVVETDKNGNFPKEDDNSNQLTPDSREVIAYSDYILHDNDYLTDEDLLFYFEKGKHTLTLEATRESIAISKLWLGSAEELPDYETYISQYDDAQVYSGEVLQFAAEISKARSEQSLTMFNDASNASTTPADPSQVRLNTIGGESWKNPGQWISWEVTVPESAKYVLSFKYRQDYVSGFKVYREIWVDGKAPCEELNCISFDPNTSWDNNTVADDEGHPYYIYLEEGTHTITLNVTLGPVAESLQILTNTVNDLNSIYRDIIAVTGTSPDSNRDYDIDRVIPDLMDNFEAVYENLIEVGGQIEKYNGVKGGLSSFIDVMTRQLELFIKDPLEIISGLSGFKTNIASLADMMSEMKSQALLLDEIYLSGDAADVPKAKVGFLKTAEFTIKGFFLSFVADYNAIGVDYENSDLVFDIDEPVEVWMISGRDQMNVLKTIIDDDFVANYNIPVNLSLVENADTLTKAILAGNGPDCALWLLDTVPISYSMRGALENLEQFDAEHQYDEQGNKKYTYTFDEVYEWFYPSSFISLRYLDGNIYGLPESQLFKMMFVRDDIMQEYGLDVPESWDDVYDIVTILQRNNMLIGIPSQDWSMFATLLLQNGNELYVDDYSAVDLSTVDAIDAFTQWTEFNTKYSIPLTFDALNRFRSGEMPIVLQDYTFYNNLEVGAPEIKGLWSMHPIPGTVQEDGTINSSQNTSGNACVMVGGCDKKEATWEFLSWWVSAKTQATFGQKIEARLGAGGRYGTANKEAFEQIPWSIGEQEMIKDSWEQVQNIAKVPGDYYVTRMVNNAFRAVVYNGTNPRESLIKYSTQMNNELKRKREEYNIDRYFTDENE